MSVHKHTQKYENALQMAEAGNHDEALSVIRKHLASNPKDAQAWNDSGAILYCAGKTEESINHFEKAKGLLGPCPEAAEIYWNLIEACLAGGYPERTPELFKVMEELDILSCDTLNRAANEFLKAEDFSNAIEMLLWSLRLSDEQEVLEPMIKIIKSKRVKVSMFCESEDEQMRLLADQLNTRYPLDVHVGKGADEVFEILSETDIAWFDGCGKLMADISHMGKVCDSIVRVRNSDVVNQGPGIVNWGNIDTVILPANSSVKRTFYDFVGDIGSDTKMIEMGLAVDTGKCEFNELSKGKRIGCVGNFNSANNLVMVIQAMQKLNYIDPDYRLYLCGEFEDKVIEEYIRHMIEVLGLGNVVFFDGEQTNLNAWARDKHYIVSGGISWDSSEAVMKCMAAGLKPLVHNFPGADEIFDSRFIYNISEDFCRMITEEDYCPSDYRRIAEAKYDIKKQFSVANNAIVRFERLINARAKLNQSETKSIGSADQAPQDRSVSPGPDVTVDSGQDQAGTFDKPIGRAIDLSNTEPIKFDTAEEKKEDSSVEVSEPVRAESFDKSEVTETGASSDLPARSNSIREGKINRIAAAALEASRVLTDLAGKDKQQPEQSSWEDIEAMNEFDNTGAGSLSDIVNEKKVKEAAAEFSSTANEGLEIKGNRCKASPFLKV